MTLAEYCILNGKIIRIDEAQISAFDQGFLYAYAIYETLSTHNQHPINWTAHYHRLTQSLGQLNINLQLDSHQLLKQIRELISLNKFPEQRIRITISAGTNTPTILISSQKLQRPSAKDYEQGVKVISQIGQRQLPTIKSTNILEQKLLLNNQPPNIYDVILTNQKQEILEGTKSNIFFVIDQKIYTPKSNILPGTTATLIKNLSPQQIIERPIKLTEISNCSEIFLTNAIIGILPVSKFNKSNFQRGPITNDLSNIYHANLPHA